MLLLLRFGSCDGRDDGKHNSTGSVEISETIMVQDAFLLGTKSFDRVH